MVLLPSSESPKTSRGENPYLPGGAFVCWEFQGNGYKPLMDGCHFSQHSDTPTTGVQLRRNVVQVPATWASASPARP